MINILKCLKFERNQERVSHTKTIDLEVEASLDESISYLYVDTRKKKYFWLESLEKLYGQDSITNETLIKVLDQDSNNYQLNKMDIPQQKNDHD